MVSNQIEQNLPFSGSFFVVSGGSKGIGKETAKEITRLGGSVCIIARGEEALAQAVDEARQGLSLPDQFVAMIACDVTDEDNLRPQLEELYADHGAPEYLLNVVGYAYPNYVTELTLADFRKNMDINYYGQLIPTMLTLPHMIEAQRGHISFVSSMAGFLGMVGYAAYSPTKFALVGLAEVLRHELKPKNISVSVLYPPDTDTPGFEKENETKPPETAMLSETAKLFTPSQVAKLYIEGPTKNKMHILIGEGRWIWRINRWFPKLVYTFMDQDYKKAIKKLGK